MAVIHRPGDVVDLTEPSTPLRLTERRIPIEGVEFDSVSRPEVERIIQGAVKLAIRPPLYVTTSNLDHVAMAASHPEFASILNDCDVALPDGMGVIWLSRLLGSPLPERVAGSDITRWLVEGGLADARLFLLGSSPDVLQEICEQARGNGVTVPGCAAPPRAVFEDEASSRRLVEEINGARVDVLLVALGAPVQETWIHRWRGALDVSVAMGVGGSFDFLAGKQKRAPELLQRIGFEWAYRLAREPRRLWRRYLQRDLPFFVRCAWKLARRGRVSRPGRTLVVSTPPTDLVVSHSPNGDGHGPASEGALSPRAQTTGDRLSP